jgi:DNA repair exonuclease SbcCD ATPase subunit
MENDMLLNGFMKTDAELGFQSETENLGEITEKLDDILLYLRNELQGKQKVIETQAAEILRMRGVIEDKVDLVQAMQQRMADIEQKAESNRQLINKLLGDISHYQKDIEWYKRTYEKRSLWGVMKEKLAKVNLPPEKPE